MRIERRDLERWERLETLDRLAPWLAIALGNVILAIIVEWMVSGRLR